MLDNIIATLFFNRVKSALKKRNIVMNELFFIDLKAGKLIIDDKELNYDQYKKDIDATVKEMTVTDLSQILITKSKITLLYGDGTKNTM